MKYFEQTQAGRSVWWSWIFGTWVALILWTLGQTILIEIITGIAGRIDPALGAEFNESTANMLSDNDRMEQYLTLFGFATLIAIASIAGVVATLWASNREMRVVAHSEVFGESVGSTGSKTVLALALLTSFAIILSIGLMTYSNGLIDSGGYMELMQQAMGVSPITYALFLLTFPIGCLGLYLAQKVVHRRSILSLHTAAKSIKWEWMAEGFVVSWVVIGALMLLGSSFGLLDIRMVFSSTAFWGFAIASLLFIPLQAGTEEIVFRGYFNQALTHIFRSKWIAFALTSLGFMALHLSNPEALEGAASGTLPIVISGYFFFGFAMCLLVWLDDGLETAIGVHAGNNCFAAILVNYDGSVLPTPSIFMATPEPLKDAIMTLIYLAIIVGIIWWRRGGPSRSGGTQSIADA